MSNFFVVCLYLACDSFGVIWQPTTGTGNAPTGRVSSRLIASAESSLEAMIREKSRNKINKEC